MDNIKVCLLTRLMIYYELNIVLDLNSDYNEGIVKKKGELEIYKN